MYDLTICIPTYRRSALFARCLSSVIDAVKETRIKIQVIIADNNNGSSYDEIWSKYKDDFSNLDIFIISSPITLDAETNWRNAIERVEAKNFLLLSDDDVIEDLHIPTCFLDGNHTIFADSRLIGVNSILDKKHGTYKRYKSLLAMVYLSTGRIKPTFCSTILTTESADKFLSLQKPIGLNGDHADGFLIVSSLVNTTYAVTLEKFVSRYSIEGYGMRFNMKIYDHLFIAKFNFIKSCLKYFPFKYSFLCLAWAILGGLKRSIILTWEKYK